MRPVKRLGESLRIARNNFLNKVGDHESTEDPDEIS